MGSGSGFGLRLGSDLGHLDVEVLAVGLVLDRRVVDGRQHLVRGRGRVGVGLGLRGLGLGFRFGFGFEGSRVRVRVRVRVKVRGLEG